MTHLRPVEPITGAIIPLYELELLTREANDVATARSIIASLAQVQPYSIAEADKRISVLKSLHLDEGRLDKLAIDMTRSRRPAGHEEIGKCLLFMERAFYNSKDKGQVSAALIFDEVVIAEPGVAALQSAVRKLWCTLDWFPSIAQLLKAVREENARWEFWQDCVAHVRAEHDILISRLEAVRSQLLRSHHELQTERLARSDALMRLSAQIKSSALHSRPWDG